MPAVSPKATILIVDDERIIRELCERALRDYRVLLAGGSEEAMRVYETEPVDLILSDVMMPGESGIVLLKKIKDLDPNAIVIIMTGFSDKDVILNALKEGADDFINKPLNLLQLKTSVDKALVRKVLKEELANIKRADQLKSSFLSLISHKLRTPITGISLFLQNARKGVFDCDEQTFRKNIEQASAETEYLAGLVTDLLQFSQVMVVDQELHREACDVNLLAADSVRKWTGIASKRAIEIDVNPGNLPVLLLDKEKITFALEQLLDNAFKFSGNFGRVSVRTTADDSKIFLIISDTGVGIPQTEQGKIFEKFYQIDPDNTGQVRGFGLGLFYARDFIRRHGGGISIDSEMGIGTTVTVTLPIKGER